jgi:hypothetical protein
MNDKCRKAERPPLFPAWQEDGCAAHQVLPDMTAGSELALGSSCEKGTL